MKSTSTAWVFPFLRAFTVLELRKMWWHRLARVTYVVMMVLLTAAVAVVVYHSEKSFAVKYEVETKELLEPYEEALAISQDQQIEYAARGDQAEDQGQDSAYFRDKADQAEKVSHQTAARMVDLTSDRIHRQFALERLELLKLCLCALLAIVGFSYLLQIIYRAIVYVVFGAAPLR